MHDLQQSTEIAEEFLNSSNAFQFEGNSFNMFPSLMTNNYDEFPLLAQSPFNCNFQNVLSPSPKSSELILDNNLSTLFQTNSTKNNDFPLSSQSSVINPSSVGSIDSGNYSYSNNDTLMASFVEDMNTGSLDMDDSIFRSLDDTDCVFDMNIFGSNNVNTSQSQLPTSKSSNLLGTQTFLPSHTDFSSSVNTSIFSATTDHNNNFVNYANNDIFTTTVANSNTIPCNASINSAISNPYTASMSNPPSINSHMDSSSTVSSPEDTLSSPFNKNLNDLPPPPKKPLSPYMRFSKGIWQQVKAANPGMTVCEVGTNIGRVWRELSEADKQRFNNDFLSDKVRYDSELQKYLQMTGLQASDLVKPKGRRKETKKDTVCRKRNTEKLDMGHDEQNIGTSQATPLVSSQQTTQDIPTTAVQNYWNDGKHEMLNNGVSCNDVVVENTNNSNKPTVVDTEQINAPYLDPSTRNLQSQISCSEQSTVTPSNTTTNPPNENVVNTNVPWQQLILSNKMDQNLLLNHLFQENNTILKQHLLLKGLQKGANCGEVLGTIDPEKLLLRSALVEKSQEVLKLMRELEQAYELIHQLKQQNDFFHQQWTLLQQQNDGLFINNDNNLSKNLTTNCNVIEEKNNSVDKEDMRQQLLRSMCNMQQQLSNKDLRGDESLQGSLSRCSETKDIVLATTSINNTN